MTTKKYTLTDEHRAQLKPWAERWIANALRTRPMDDADREAMRTAMRGLYAAANLTPPPREVFVASPRVAVFASGIAAGVWWLRENPGRHGALFGGALDEPAIRAAMVAACGVADGRKPRMRQQPATNAATYAATDEATRAATRAATNAATNTATNAATYEATNAATRAATNEATDDATSAATNAATYEATNTATDEATYAATNTATNEATNAATRAATNTATNEATNAATRAATNTATNAATYEATYAATRAATYAATNAATDDATYAATRAATYAATNAATRAATYAATDEATRAATDDATYAATRAATYAATDEATYAATYDATRAATDDATYEATMFLLRCAAMSYRLRHGGNMWSGWAAYISFFRHVSKLAIDYSKWQHYESAAIHGSVRHIHPKFWIVSDFPTTVGRDEQNRSHSDTGPALAWSDGWRVYNWHGVKVPADVIEHPETITVARIDAEQNAEVRRCMIAKYGAAKYLLDTGAKPTQRDDFGVLYRRDVAGDDPIVMVRLLNSTPEPDGTLDDDTAGDVFGDGVVKRNRERIGAILGMPQAPTRWKEYWLRVPPETKTAHEAVAWSFGMTPAKAPIRGQFRQGDVTISASDDGYFPEAET